ASLGARASARLIAERRHSLGLDQSLPVQFGRFLKGIVQGDLGQSITLQMPVSTILGDRLQPTLLLAALAFTVIAVVALPLGLGVAVLTENGRRRPAELTFNAITGGLAALPEFLLAVGLVWVFAVTLQALPIAGRSGPESYVLPVASLAVGAVAGLARVVRVEASRVLGEDYMRTVRLKRLPARLRYLRHALPNLLTSSLTLSGLLLSSLIAGTVLVENVFAWPGLGTTIVDSITARDYPLVQGVVLVYGCATLLVNFTVDVLIAMVDPRSTIKEA
ncbi:ABC transporter permease, partial [Streptomyces anulatus]|uniref:ABC transporter permease n=1 Tax=Streptomyces anulatus TaxID=1892 RepID=UPI003415DA78